MKVFFITDSVGENIEISAFFLIKSQLKQNMK